MASRTTVTRTTTAPPAYRAPVRPSEPELEWQEPEPEPEITEPVSDVVPVGVEQLARSLEIEAMGVEAWKAAHDERGPEYQQQAVEGVGTPPEPEDVYGRR
jgi:hypothetical protein